MFSQNRNEPILGGFPHKELDYKTIYLFNN